MIGREAFVLGRSFSFIYSSPICRSSPSLANILESLHPGNVQQKRHYNRAYTELKHPRTPHIMKLKMLKATEPIYLKPELHPADICVKQLGLVTSKEMPEHPLEVILADRMREVLASNRMAILAHRNPMTQRTFKAYQNSVWKLDVRMWQEFNNRVMRCAVKDSKYSVLEPFLEGNNLLVTCKDVDFVKTVRALKRIPSITAMVIIVDQNFIITVPQLELLARTFPHGIVGAHSQLVATLSSLTGTLAQSLQFNQNQLSSNLRFLSSDDKDAKN